MPRAPRSLPEDLGKEFSFAEAIARGISRRRLRAQDLVSPYYGVRRRIEPAKQDATDDQPLSIDRVQRERVLAEARAYATVMMPGSFFCGRTAAVILDAPVEHPGELEVAVIAPRRAPRGRGIKGRKIAEHLVSQRMHEGLPTSSPASTWAMLCTELSERELVRLGDAMVRIPRDEFGTPHPEQALATLAQLQAAVEAGPRPPQTRRLRTALERVRVGSSSPLETDFRLDAEDAGLPEPVLDMEIRGDDGRLLGISEFAFPNFRTVVEVEGDHHRTSKAQWNRDIEKYQAYAEAGWEPVRLTSAHIRGTIPTAVAIVRRVLIRRGWDGARA